MLGDNITLRHHSGKVIDFASEHGDRLPANPSRPMAVLHAIPGQPVTSGVKRHPEYRTSSKNPLKAAQSVMVLSGVRHPA
jgi:hypothetical protein